ncbi:uncharacterized protein ATC70_013016 [Mucor velutinosus]|uniref:Uncharacterized protein n=1 Tax=Mucor velutinosus TaxID=708070 RepID=A0AAN7DEE2_9FUNG|nr:hypothetical protein ATC70_013016 [Mucor velutinosus]
MLGNDYVYLTYKYRATLNQLCVSVAASDISHLGFNTITNYLHQFPCLKCLSLDTSCPIVCDALIQACPQLQMLKLKAHSSGISFKVIGHDRNGTTPALNLASQLETLKVHGSLMSRQFYQYLKHCCTFLSHLAITLAPDADFDPLIDTFDAFTDAQALTINSISLDNYSTEVNGWMQSLGRWFPQLKQVEIKGFDLASVENNHYNLSLDFNQLDL